MAVELIKYVDGREVENIPIPAGSRLTWNAGDSGEIICSVIAGRGSEDAFVSSIGGDMPYKHIATLGSQDACGIPLSSNEQVVVFNSNSS